MPRLFPTDKREERGNLLYLWYTCRFGSHVRGATALDLKSANDAPSFAPSPWLCPFVHTSTTPSFFLGRAWHWRTCKMEWTRKRTLWSSAHLNDGFRREENTFYRFFGRSSTSNWSCHSEEYQEGYDILGQRFQWVLPGKELYYWSAGVQRRRAQQGPLSFLLRFSDKEWWVLQEVLPPSSKSFHRTVRNCWLETPDNKLVPNPWASGV